MPQQNTLLPDVLQFVRYSSALNKRALDERAQLKTKLAKAAEKKAGVIQHLITTNTITEADRVKVAEMLDDPSQTLELLKNAASRIQELAKTNVKSAGDLGSGVGEDGQVGKTASAPKEHDPNWSLSSAFVGGRTSEKKASDVALFRGLGLPVGGA